MATRRTKDEKLKLIADYEESGLSLSEWCATNGISKSTFAGWIRSTKADVRTPKSKTKFVGVNDSSRITGALRTTIEEWRAEFEVLKSELKEKDEKIQSLEKVNNWYIEQLKLKAKEKFGVSSEKVNPDQLSLFDLFNEVETLQELITIEPELETVVKAHSRKKSSEKVNSIIFLLRLLNISLMKAK